MEYLSAEKLKELQKELEQLKTVRRKEVADSLEFAKSMGDLSENAEYIQAREDQAGIEERIAKLEMILKSVVVVSKHHSNIIEVGSTAVVQKKGATDTQKYQIVGSEESDMSTGKISNASALGVALFGKKKGEEFSFKTPKGAVAHYTIIDIE